MSKPVLQRARVVVLLYCLAVAVLSPALSNAQHGGGTHAEQESVAANHDHHGGGEASTGWEGSAAGVAYSEQNHHIAGWMVILMGLAELSHVMRFSSLRWTRLLLPSAMLSVGLFVTVWSDHEAWPVGRLSFADSFFGQDHEIIQHKVYGLLALAVGSVELFRRLGWMGHLAWATPLPLMAVVGGLMLFGHSHGVHPSAQKIAMHHAIMGTMAVTAGSSKLLSNWTHTGSGPASSRWEWLWAWLILLIGVQLLIYSE